MAQRDFEDASREQWSGAADKWSQAAEEPDSGASAAAAAWILGALELQPGERVLEVACGAGRVGLQAAELVGERGSVVCSDFAEPMVEVVRARVSRLGLQNVEAQVLDAEQMSFEPDERFDAALCRMGFMLMSDPGAALRNTRAALRPGGRLALAVWGSGEANPWLSTIFTAVMGHLGAPPPVPGAPGPFALGDSGQLGALLEAGGFPEPSVEVLEVPQAYPSPEAWWDEVLGLGGPLGALIGSLPEESAGAIRSTALEEAKAFEVDGSVVFPASVVAALGVANPP